MKIHLRSSVFVQGFALLLARLLLLAAAGCTSPDVSSQAPAADEQVLPGAGAPGVPGAGGYREIVETLAGDACDGRGWGTPGLAVAGDYLMDVVQHQLHLSPGMKDGGFAQHVESREVDDTLTASRNIVAMLPGRGALRNEVVLLLAHYDHLGHDARFSLAPADPRWQEIYTALADGLPGPMHPGADDNASGVAAVLTAMRLIQPQLQREPNRRTVVVLLTTGEEYGFIGLRYLLSHEDELAFAVGDITAAMNVDMVGHLRDDRLSVYYTDEWAGWRPVFVQANEAVGLRLVMDEDPPGFGDELMLRKMDVPAVLLNTGLHDDYHRPSDTPATLNYAGAARVVRLIATACEVLATQQ